MLLAFYAEGLALQCYLLYYVCMKSFSTTRGREGEKGGGESGREREGERFYILYSFVEWNANQVNKKSPSILSNLERLDWWWNIVSFNQNVPLLSDSVVFTLWSLTYISWWTPPVQ